MEQCNSFDSATDQPTFVPASRHWLAEGEESALDCETAFQLRCYLGPCFEQASTWQDLLNRLMDKGFDLSFQGARLVLSDKLSARQICTTRFLGAPLFLLVERLGRPCVRMTGPTSGIIHA